jgi:uncharacterized protein
MTVARSSAFHVMAKPTGPLCNLACAYCFYLETEQLYPERTTRAAWAMADAVLDSYIRQYIEAQRTDVVNFAWQGGEPTLLGVDYFARVVALQRKYANGKTIENAFQTNGVLLDERWARFLAENRFLVGLSLDGPQEFHDRYRLHKDGRETFAAVMRALKLLQWQGVSFNTLTCVQRHNSQAPLAVYRFLKDAGSTFTQFIPVVERVGEKVAEWSVEPLQYGRFLCDVFDEWVRRDVGTVFVQLFETALAKWMRVPGGLCVFEEACGDALAIEHNGDVYSCDHYVHPGHLLGNIQVEGLQALVGSERQRRFGLDKRDALPRFCRQCGVRFACHGGCPKHRFARTADGEAGLNYLCPSFKLFFAHAGPYLQFLADELREGRAPGGVMQWARERAPAPPGPRPKRHDPCPCGSGRIYKACCGRRSAPSGSSM